MRRIITILALGLVIYLLRRLARHREARARPAPLRPEAGGQPLVRDRICNTYLPEAGAIRLHHLDQWHFFCSATCRDRFLERQPAPPA